MAIGTGNLPYPGKVYNPFDILTAEEMNEDVANIESLATGAGLGDGAVTAIKTAFGGSYSTSEVNTGFKWIDGKDIYKKTVDFGTLPNATTKNVAHGISGLEMIISISGVAYSPGVAFLPLGLPHPTAANSISLFANSIDISILTGSNRTTYTSSYVTLYYTKT